MSEPSYLNAIVERGKSFRVLTEEYSRDAVKELMSQAPEAIALAPAGTVDATKLIAELKAFRDKPRRRYRAHGHRWNCYWRDLNEQSLRYCGVLDDERHVGEKFEELHQKRTFSILVLICVESALDKAFAAACSKELPSHTPVIPFISASHFEALFEGVFHSKETATDRASLRVVRQQLLDKVATFTSEDLATAAGSVTNNASQYALDLRSRGKVFGVRFGRTWHYPRFQFDAQRRALPEMKAVLDALSPDPQGWDRLQWFITPHERLTGRSPLQMWDSDRNKVIEAAQTEHWHGRRD